MRILRGGLDGVEEVVIVGVVEECLVFRGFWRMKNWCR